MKLILTGRVGSVWADKGDNDIWWGWYDITVWYQNHRYSTRIEFDNIGDYKHIPWQDEAVSVEFNVETKEITIL